MLAPNTAQKNGTAVTKSVVSAAIVEAVRSHSNGTAALHAKVPQRVCEGGAHTHPLVHVYVLSFTPFFLFVVVSIIDGSLIRGSTLNIVP